MGRLIARGRRFATLPNLMLGVVLASAAWAFYLHDRPTVEGDRLKPFALSGPSGPMVRSADLAGRVVFVNIWASWCGPCREELPKLDSLAARFDSTRVTFAALSDDTEGWAAREMITVFGGLPHLRIGLGLGALKREYRYFGLPFSMLVDASGRVVRTWPGYGGPSQIAAIDSLIRQLAPGAARDVIPVGRAATPNAYPGAPPTR